MASGTEPRSGDLPGLPRAAVTRWLDEHVPGLLGRGPWHAEVIAGGLSNIMYRLRSGERSVVLRRPPLGNLLPSAHDMVREYTVQSALAASPVPVPALLAICRDESVIGVPFYVMQDVPGDVLRTSQDTAALDPVARAGVAAALVRTLVDLHAVDIDAVGLSDFGRPSGYAQRQVRRWGQQWERSATRELPDMATLLGLLAERVPPQPESAILHGDYRLDNTIVDGSADPPRVRAVLDWELSTLGDPLADLGLLLTYWYDGSGVEDAAIPQGAGLTAAAGFPTADQLAEQYGTLSGRDLSGLAFYRALGAMKLAVILEGVHARYLGGQTVGAGYDRVGPAVPVLTARALDLLR